LDLLGLVFSKADFIKTEDTPTCGQRFIPFRPEL